MATAVISGRVDVSVRDRANAYIHAAGLTAAEVIKSVWEGIARTGEMPYQQSAEAEQVEAAEQTPFEAFVELCDEMNEKYPPQEWFTNLTTEQMRDMIAQEKWEKYEQL